ncbi:aminoacyl-tRNA hydrolase [Erysipelothrix inopinata]|uniref:Peptidyl-tRNA hydrolase n=1 Tax=Erysipelothrix inopinata TaxID=225084 RepID=A0A7G9S0F2_9FIRM|nr:aminoacyl-tRNA hydrolase [Erysipelothrix inopinata]QNN61327.1 aminoacyl-tRNA hydrolase [Erysipelothrix inopinata]
MKVIVGLGNPGKEYEKTRHNAGFMVVDGLADKLNIDINTKKHKALIGVGHYQGQKIMLVKPQTYMNLSGETVGEIVRYYDLDLDDLLIVSDDLDSEIGVIRIRLKGSSGGQNGIKSIINHLGTQEFNRLKIGIGKSSIIKTVDYVLGKMDDGVAIDRGIACAYSFAIGTDIMKIMNEFNRKD